MGKEKPIIEIPPPRGWEKFGGGFLATYYIKTNRVFTTLRKYGWIFTVLVALGGSFVEPKLGLGVIGIMAGLIGTSFFKGRYWCGNICPHGSLFDSLIHPISLNKNIPGFLKSKPMILGFFIFFMYNFGGNTLNALQHWGDASFWDRLGMVFSRTYLMVFVVGGLLGLIRNPRTWCQFCPMGTLEKGSYALGTKLNLNKSTDKKLTIESKEKCHACGKCARVCPFQLEPYTNFSENNQFDDVNCIRCGTCVENCPAGILSFENEREALELKLNSNLEGYEERQKIVAIITTINELDKEVKEFTFAFKDPAKVAYKAGQFILVKLKGHEKMFRAYSIASYNEDDRKLSVIIKKVAKGYGTENIFEHFREGDTVELEGPMGEELVVARDVKKVLFIGNGIGMTPFIPLTKDTLLHRKEIEQVTFVHGQRREKDFYYQDYFLELEKSYQRFDYLPIASRPEKVETMKGYVMDGIKNLNLEDHHVYMCGSPRMIRDTMNLLLEKGVPKERIFYESEEKIKLDDKQELTKKNKKSA